MDRAAEREHERLMAARYRKARFLLEQIKLSPRLTREQKKTLRGQAVSGDLAGAEKGFRKLVRME